MTAIKIPPLLKVSAIVVSAINFSGCKELKDVIPPFDIETDNISFNIPIVTDVGAERALGTGNTYYDLQSEMDADGYIIQVDDLESIKATEIKLTLSNADNGNNLANFQELKIYFSAQGTPETLMASATIPNSFSNNITIPVSNSPELKSYFYGDDLTFTVRGTARTATSKVLNAVMRVKFLVIP